MNHQINFNGKVIDAASPILRAGNRAFGYGDGLFETIRVFDGKIPFLKDHINRLRKGLSILKFNVPEHYSTAFFKDEIQQLTNGEGNHRIRLTVFRSDGGFYAPRGNDPQFLIESQGLNNASFSLNTKGLLLGIFDELKLPMNRLSNLKTCNGLPYVLAGIFCQENSLDDCILFNSLGNIAESSNSNIFFVAGTELFTPSLSEACIEGTMRNLILEVAEILNYRVNITSLALDDLEGIDEIWLTNAIHGIRWVEHFGQYRLLNQKAQAFVQLLNKKIKDFNE